MLKNEIKEKELEIKKNKPLKEKLEEEKLKQKKEISILKKKIEENLPKLDKIKQLESRKLDLVKYAKDAIYLIQNEVSEKERKIYGIAEKQFSKYLCGGEK